MRHGIHKQSETALSQIERSLRLLVDTTGPSTHVMAPRCARTRIGVVDGVLGRTHAPAGEEGEAAANGDWRSTEGMLGIACALGRAGYIHGAEHGGTRQGGTE